MTNIAALAEMDGKKNQTYPQWTTMSQAVNSGTAGPLLFAWVKVQNLKSPELRNSNLKTCSMHILILSS